MLALMLGPEHFGLPIGDIFKVGPQLENGLHTQCRKGTNWFTYLLPPPCSIEGKIHSLCGKNTCFIVLLLFLLFPGLRFVPAFNRGGADWTGSQLTCTSVGAMITLQSLFTVCILSMTVNQITCCVKVYTARRAVALGVAYCATLQSLFTRQKRMK